MKISFQYVKKQLLIITLLFSILAVTAQTTGVVSGEVLDKNTQELIPYASIVIKQESKIITGGITNDTGAFIIKKIPLGKYTVEIQYIGYNTVIKEVALLKSNEVVKLGPILIKEDAVALEGVEITVERSTIEQKIDRKVINVGKDLTTLGASASDIMGNIPSVSVDQDGEISLRGNENVRILIDGKPTNISSADLLQQIPSTTIKKIELITNPSAKYNPEGMSGIINIVLKKSARLGFNGTISTGITVGKQTRFNNALSLNYREGKFNVYGNYGNRFGKQITDGTVSRLDENTNQLTGLISDNTSHLFKLGVDFYINDKNTVSVYTNQNLFKNTTGGTKSVTFFDDSSLNFVQIDALSKKK